MTAADAWAVFWGVIATTWVCIAVVVIGTGSWRAFPDFINDVSALLRKTWSGAIRNSR